MSIEDKARSWLVQAIRSESELTNFETTTKACSDSHKHRDLQKRFVRCLAKLNSVANTQGKGRDDFDAMVLERAKVVLKSPVSKVDEAEVVAAETAHALASEVLESYIA